MYRKGQGTVLQGTGGGGMPSVGSGAAAMARSFGALADIGTQGLAWADQRIARHKDEELKRNLTAAQDLGRKNGTMYDPNGKIQHLGPGTDVTGGYTDPDLAAAFRSALFGSHKAATISNSQQELAKLLQKHYNDPAGFSSAANKYVQGIASGSEESYFNYLEPELIAVVQNLETQQLTRLAEVQRNNIKTNLETGQTAARNTAINLSMNGQFNSDEATTAVGSFEEYTDNLVENGNLTPKEAAEAKQNLQTEMALSSDIYNIETAYREKGLGEATKILAEINTRKFGGLDPDAVQRYKASANSHLNKLVSRTNSINRKNEVEKKRKQDDLFREMIIARKNGTTFLEPELQQLFSTGKIRFDQYTKLSGMNETDAKALQTRIHKNHDAAILIDITDGNFGSYINVANAWNAGQSDMTPERFLPLKKAYDKKVKQLTDAAIEATSLKWKEITAQWKVDYSVTPDQWKKVLQGRSNVTKEDWTEWTTYAKSYATEATKRANFNRVMRNANNGQRISKQTDMNTIYPDGALSAHDPNNHATILSQFDQTKNLLQDNIDELKTAAFDPTASSNLNQTLSLFRALQQKHPGQFGAFLKQTLGEKIYERLDRISREYQPTDDPNEAQKRLTQVYGQLQSDNASGSRRLAAIGDDPQRRELTRNIVSDLLEKHTGILSAMQINTATGDELESNLSETFSYFGGPNLPDELPPAMEDAIFQYANNLIANGVYSNDEQGFEKAVEAGLLNARQQGWSVEPKLEQISQYPGTFGANIFGVELPFFPGQSFDETGEISRDDYVWVKNGILAAAQHTVPPSLKGEGFKVTMQDIQRNVRSVAQLLYPDADIASDTVFRFKQIPGTQNNQQSMFDPVPQIGSAEDETGVVTEYFQRYPIAVPSYQVEMMDRDGQWITLRNPAGKPLPYSYNWSNTEGPDLLQSAITKYQNSWMKPYVDARLTGLFGVTPGQTIADYLKANQQALVEIDDVLEFGQSINDLLKVFNAPQLDLSQITPEALAATNTDPVDVAMAIDMAYFRLLGEGVSNLVSSEASQTMQRVSSAMDGTSPLFDLNKYRNTPVPPLAKKKKPKQANPIVGPNNPADIDATDDTQRTSSIGGPNNPADIVASDDSVTPATTIYPDTSEIDASDDIQQVRLVMNNQKVLQSKATGKDVVKSAVNEVDTVLGGGNFLYEIAQVESQMGGHSDTFGKKSRGIWQIDPVGFEDTQKLRGNNRDARMKDAWKSIKRAFGIDWSKVSYDQLNTPLYGALAARLHLIQNYGVDVPNTLDKRAKVWKEHYNKSGKGTPQKYKSRVKNLN